MKRLIFIILAFISLTAHSQYVIQRPIPNRVVYPAITNQWVNIKFDPTTVRESIPNWNWFLENASPKTGLLDETGVNSGYSIEKVSGSNWLYEQQTPSGTDADFPLLVKKHMVYTDPSQSKTLRIGGLDNSKTYTLIFATFFSAGGNENRSEIVINGTPYPFNPLATNSSLGKLTFSSIAPTSGFITFQIIGADPDNSYACINGMKIKPN